MQLRYFQISASLTNWEYVYLFDQPLVFKFTALLLVLPASLPTTMTFAYYKNNNIRIRMNLDAINPKTPHILIYSLPRSNFIFGRIYPLSTSGSIIQPNLTIFNKNNQQFFPYNNFYNVRFIIALYISNTITIVISTIHS